MREPPRKELGPLRITTKNEGRIMARNNGLEVRISKEETTTIVTMGLGGTRPIITRIPLQEQFLHMGIIAQTMEDRLINAQISHLIEAMETDLAMNLSTISVETGGTMETFLVLHRLKGETSHKLNPIADQEVINLITLLSADLTINL